LPTLIYICSEFCDVVVTAVQHYLKMPDFEFFLCWTGTSSFIFRYAWGTSDRKNGAQSTHCH